MKVDIGHSSTQGLESDIILGIALVYKRIFSLVPLYWLVDLWQANLVRDDNKESRLRLWNMVVQSTLYKNKLHQFVDSEFYSKAIQ